MLFGLVMLVVIAVIGLWPLPVPYPIPEPEQVVAMQLRLPWGQPTEKFEIPSKQFASFFAALRPYHRDHHPATWAIHGELDLTLQTGSHFGIWLFQTGDEEGAFAAGPSWEKRTYYRGGTDQGIKDAILAARGP